MPSVPGKTDRGTQCSPPPPADDDENHYRSSAGEQLVKEDVAGGGGAELTNKRKVEEERTDVAETTKMKKKKPERRDSAAKRAQPSRRPGFSDERFDETSYYVENGLRKVYPYYFTFTTYTKGRWVGRTLSDVFGEEFRAHSADVYERHIADGSLTVNNERVAADYVLKHNDLLSNRVHRHEVPVTGDRIDILHVDRDTVVVNKPASLPVHPCGRYRHNTVVFLLAKEHGLRDLKTVHRLDRLTSGVLMFGRTRDRAAALEAQIRDRLVRKRYVCRVEGRFPDGGPVQCAEPVLVVSHKIGVCKVSAAGKPCHTTFRAAGYDAASDSTVVLCEPRSGRMHQIRVHLQYLGHPIVNDPLYNDRLFGPHKGRGGHFGGKTDAELVRDLIRAHNAETWRPPDDAPPDEAPPPPPPVTDACTQTGMDLPDSGFDASKASVDPHCLDCRVRYRDPQPKDLVMFLHAYEYSGPDWAYETPMPAWASADWKQQQ